MTATPDIDGLKAERPTQEEIAELRRLCEEATPGPWLLTSCLDAWVEHSQPLHPEDNGFTGIAHCGDVAWPNAQNRQVAWEANARFIAAARDMVPRLLDAIPTASPVPELELTAATPDIDGLRAEMVSGMETTAEGREFGMGMSAGADYADRLRRDIARLSAALAEAREDGWNNGFTEGYNEAFEKYGKDAALSADPPVSTDRERPAQRLEEEAAIFVIEPHKGDLYREAAAFIRQPVAAEIAIMTDRVDAVAKLLRSPNESWPAVTLEEAAALLRRLVPAGEGWHDIASAPKVKNGPVALLARLSDGRLFWAQAVCWNGLGWYTPTGIAIYGATHWMPLPSPPMEDKS